jgi:hypothetical protein
VNKKQVITPYLINELAAMEVVGNKNLGPQLWLATFDKITRLLLEHRVVVGDSNELVVTETFGIRNIRQIGVSGLAELSDN